MIQINKMKEEMKEMKETKENKDIRLNLQYKIDIHQKNILIIV